MPFSLYSRCSYSKYLSDAFHLDEMSDGLERIMNMYWAANFGLEIFWEFVSRLARLQVHMDMYHWHIGDEFACAYV